MKTSSRHPPGGKKHPRELLHTSQTYLLFQTLLLLFCPHSCIIWTKLTRTNDVFSRAACMVYLCAGKWIFRRPRKFPEKYQKIHAPGGAKCHKWDQRGALGAPGAPRAPLWSHLWHLAPPGAWIFWYFSGNFLGRLKIHFPAHK